jgi:hypothetical protein
VSEPLERGGSCPDFTGELHLDNKAITVITPNTSSTADPRECRVTGGQCVVRVHVSKGLQTSCHACVFRIPLSCVVRVHSGHRLGRAAVLRDSVSVVVPRRRLKLYGNQPGSSPASLTLRGQG